MSEVSPRFSQEIHEALTALAALPARAAHRLQVGLAKLVLEQAPPAAASQLDLALAFIDGRATAAELKEARQDCWVYVGAVADQVERVLRCGAAELRVLGVLRGLDPLRH